MPRTRLRPDYVTRNYTYHCLLPTPPPQIFWDLARAQQTLWNACVTAHETMRAPWHDVEPDKATKHAAYDTLRHQLYLLCRDEGEALGLAAWQKWDVYERFQNALRAFGKHLRAAPRLHQGLQSVRFQHRTTSGGVPLAWLWLNGQRKHTAILPAPPDHHHRPGYTTIGGVRIPLLVLLHRPVPDDAILKRITLLGTQERYLRHGTPAGWQWRLQLTVEVPPPLAAPAQGRSLGIDVGWRAFEHGLRVAVLSDGTHHWEVTLPWDMASRATRRRQSFYARQGLTLDTTGRWQDLWLWKSRIDEDLETCKQALMTEAHAGWPPVAQALWRGHERVRAGGLRRLRRALGEAGIVLPVLEAWQQRYREQMMRYRGTELHLQRRRNHLYRLLADWIAQHYDAVSLEGDLVLQELAEAPRVHRRARGQAGAETALPRDERVERLAAKYRQMASVSTLRLYIREACAKQRRLVHDGPTAYTSQTCMVPTCGEAMSLGPDLLRVCPAGHQQDQDVAAAVLLWRALPASVRALAPALPGELPAQVPLRRVPASG